MKRSHSINRPTFRIDDDHSLRYINKSLLNATYLYLANIFATRKGGRP